MKRHPYIFYIPNTKNRETAKELKKYQKVEKSMKLKYNNTMSKIDRINDKIFKKIIRDTETARVFLKKILPEEIKKRIDFSNIEIGPTDYVSKEFKEYFSDVIVKTKMISKDCRKLHTDICFILEHKTEGKRKIFIQFLKYMVQEWQKDIEESKPLRIIIPIVFYHGKEDWKISQSFVDQFNVDEEVKEFLLNYKYILFDTRPWDFRNESNEELKDNIFLFTAMALMKCAYTDETETIEEIFKFWREKGFTEDIENVIFFLTYISETKNISRNQLKEILEKSKIEGGKIMETLAQRLRAEGAKEGKLETARELLKNGVDIRIIARSTGLPEKEIEKLAATVQ